MQSIELVNYNTIPGDLDYSQIMDLECVTINGTEVLISSTQFDGVLATWDISGGGLTRADARDFDDMTMPGGISTITILGLNGANGVLAGGPLQTVTVNSDGSLGSTTALGGLPAEMTGFQHGITVILPSGTQAVYGGLAGADGIGRLDFSDTGTLQGHSIISGPGDSFTAEVSALGAAEVAGQTYLLSASGSDNGVTSWAVAADGTLSVAENLGNDEGLWISTPTAMEMATVGGSTFAVLASAGSNSLSVLEIGDDGSLIIREHLLDTLGTRFGGVTAIEVIDYDGKTYVIAGGADDGLSVFVLLEGGQLVALAHIADSDLMGLDNVSAITGRGRDGGLDLYVASSTEHGVTQLRFDTGTTGITVTATLAGGILAATGGNDILQGHNGDDIIDGGTGNDIIRDGAGTDTLTGGAGADVFILSADGETDTITDFTVGEDSIDLSLWPLLRDISQLTIRILSDGMEIRYGDEVLIVRSADGTPIDYRDLETSDLIGGTRLPQNIEPGYPGPARPPPNPDPPDPPVDQGGPNDPFAGVVVLTEGNLDDLRDAVAATPSPPPTSGVISGDTGADTLGGSPVDDVVIAGDGDDLVNGGDGADTLLGRGGNDTLYGDDGPDVLIGGAGNDNLHGGNGQDLLRGGDGEDTLGGGAGDDVLYGEGDADTFIFDGGSDVIQDYEQGLDQITLDAQLWTGLTSAEDVLFIYGSINGTQATIDFGDGNVLIIDGVVDYNTFADDIALF